MRIREKEITKAIRDFLTALGIFHWKQMQGMGSVKGVPDIVGIFQGKMLAIEVKAPKGKASEHQKFFIQAINRHGGIAFVARSIEDVIRHLGLEDRVLL
jgi:Holliday junction resolvase